MYRQLARGFLFRGFLEAFFKLGKNVWKTLTVLILPSLTG